jgi:hypothetical protein
LRDDNVLEKIMSKLIGSDGQDKNKTVTLSKSIADWVGDV